MFVKKLFIFMCYIQIIVGGKGDQCVGLTTS